MGYPERHDSNSGVLEAHPYSAQRQGHVQFLACAPCCLILGRLGLRTSSTPRECYSSHSRNLRRVACDLPQAYQLLCCQADISRIGHYNECERGCSLFCHRILNSCNLDRLSIFVPHANRSRRVSLHGCVSHSDSVIEGAFEPEGTASPASGRPLHLPPYKCPFLAVVLVNSVPQCGQTDFMALPLFSR